MIKKIIKSQRGLDKYNGPLCILDTSAKCLSPFADLFVLQRTEERGRSADLVAHRDEVEGEGIRDGYVVVVQLLQQLLSEGRQERLQDRSEKDRQIEAQRDDRLAALLGAFFEQVPGLMILQIHIAFRGYLEYRY